MFTSKVNPNWIKENPRPEMTKPMKGISFFEAGMALHMAYGLRDKK